MLATHTSFSTTNTAQLPVAVPLLFLFCLASEIVWGTVGYVVEVGRRGVTKKKSDD